MDYGNPKPMPAAGAGLIIFGSALLGQIVIGIGCAILVLLAALLIRWLWRRNRSIGK